MIWTIIWDDQTVSRVVTDYNDRGEAINRAMKIKTFNGSREIFATIKGDVLPTVEFGVQKNEY